MPLNFEQIDRDIESAESILDVLRVVMTVNIASGLKGTPIDLENAFMSELASLGG